jgi:hypothetical protein
MDMALDGGKFAKGNRKNVYESGLHQYETLGTVKSLLF